MGAQHATGAYFLFMNNDMEVRDADWLEELVRWTQIPEIGVVGGLLLLPEGTIQHAGVIVGAHGIAGHIFYGNKDHEARCTGAWTGTVIIWR